MSKWVYAFGGEHSEGNAWCRCAPARAVSMPGMMDTVLNLGLNDETVEGLAKERRRALRL